MLSSRGRFSVSMHERRADGLSSCISDSTSSRQFSSTTSSSASASATGSSYFDDYCIGHKLGRGAFGQVYVAMRVRSAPPGSQTEKIVDARDSRAVKIVDVQSSSNNDRRSKIVQNEIAIGSRLRGRVHFVNMYDVFFGDGLYYLVMEKCNASLLSHLEGLGDDLNERSLGGIFSQMLTAIIQLHMLHVVHRDIKPDNFLVGGEDGVTIKLADFGMAALTNDGKLKREVGTAAFMCPEMVAGEEYDEKADMWSFGVLVYALLFGRLPYFPTEQTPAAMKRAILNNSTEPTFGSEVALTGSAIAFSMQLLTRDPARRLSGKGAMKTAYMMSILTKCHELGENLPSLRPTLGVAVKMQAFENRTLASGSLDAKLDKLQMEHLGLSLSETSQSSVGLAGTASAHWTTSSRRRSEVSVRSSTSSNVSTHLPSNFTMASDRFSNQGFDGASWTSTSTWQSVTNVLHERAAVVAATTCDV